MSDEEPEIWTTTGRVPVSRLGAVLVHEHLLCDLTSYWRPDDERPASWERVSELNVEQVRAHPVLSRDNLTLHALEDAKAELETYAAAGGQTVVELTTDGAGRDLRGLALLATLTGVTIIAGTGYYIEASHPAGLARRSALDIAEQLHADLVDGRGHERIRAGVMGEIGVSAFPLPSAERLVLEAVADVHRATLAPVVLHSPPDFRAVRSAVALLVERGCDPRAIAVSHVDAWFCNDRDALRELLSFGVFLGLDTFGNERFSPRAGLSTPTDAERIRLIEWLAGQAALDRVLVSHDICMKTHLNRWGGPGLGHLPMRVLPEIDRILATTDSRARLLVDGPRGFLDVSARRMT